MRLVAAVDSNMETISQLEAIVSEADKRPAAGLARILLRQLIFRANALDTELRTFMLAIQPDVQREKENERP